MKVIIIAVVVVVVLLYLFWLSPQGKIETGWFNREAKDYLSIAIDKFGKPKSILTSRGGEAIWGVHELRGTIFKELVLKDEALYDPDSDTFGFFYATVPFEVIPSKLKETLIISNNVFYNAEKKSLTARSDSWGGCVILLQIAVSVGNGKYNNAYLKSSGLLQKSISDRNDPVLVQQSYLRLKKGLEFQSGNPEN